MPFYQTAIPGIRIYEPTIWKDDRGYFFESYNAQVFHEEGLTNDFVQDNEAKSTLGVLRGLHYQVPPFAQSKLVRVVKGKVLDIAVDIREGSSTYGQWYGIELSEENKRQLFIPKGFAHGYLSLSEEVIFCYKCDNLYSREHEGGISYKDPMLQIDWGLPEETLIVSEKDQTLPDFGQHRKFRNL